MLFVTSCSLQQFKVMVYTVYMCILISTAVELIVLDDSSTNNTNTNMWTVSVILSFWLSHCKNSLSSFDKCKMAEPWTKPSN